MLSVLRNLCFILYFPQKINISLRFHEFKVKTFNMVLDNFSHYDECGCLSVIK
jgi:hypothetical protein